MSRESNRSIRQLTTSVTLFILPEVDILFRVSSHSFCIHICLLVLDHTTQHFTIPLRPLLHGLRRIYFLLSRISRSLSPNLQYRTSTTNLLLTDFQRTYWWTTASLPFLKVFSMLGYVFSQYSHTWVLIKVVISVLNYPAFFSVRVITRYSWVLLTLCRKRKNLEINFRILWWSEPSRTLQKSRLRKRKSTHFTPIFVILVS